MKAHKEIGGYFQLELQNRVHLHPEALRVNSCRNALQLLMRALTLERVLLPAFSCSAVFEALRREEVFFETYKTNEQFEPQLPPDLSKTDYVIINNYFGLCDDIIARYAGEPNIIVDNAQSFFSSPLEVVGTIYSPRKYVGVADGGMLMTNKNVELPLEFDSSTTYSEQLFTRIEQGATAGYGQYLRTEEWISKQPPLKMSHLTDRILTSINYDNIRKRRIENYHFLQEKLDGVNDFSKSWNGKQVPLCYPFVRSKKNKVLREKLLQANIFCPLYWPNVFADNDDSGAFEFEKNIIPLPIDQRYGREEMEIIIKIVTS
jgi:hypothetical protein